jgi:hypothetical protein
VLPHVGRLCLWKVEIGLIESAGLLQRGPVQDRDGPPVGADQACCPHALNGPVDVYRREPGGVAELLLRQRPIDRVARRNRPGCLTHSEFAEKVRDALACVAATDASTSVSRHSARAMFGNSAATLSKAP